MTNKEIDTRANPLVVPINYIVPGKGKPRILVDENGRVGHRNEFERREYRVAIRDIRGSKQKYQLEHNGLAFVSYESSIAEFVEFAEHQPVYDEEIQELILSHSEAREVVVFDHTIRLDDNATDGRKPVRHAHGDYTSRSGPQRVRDLLTESEADFWQTQRYGIVNAWRPINGPVETAPLAFVDPRTIAPADLVATDLVYPDRVGEIFELAYNPNHLWIYLSGQRIDEVTLFVTFDSGVVGNQKIAPHTAFDLPATNRYSKPRHSIESRALVLF